jgi:hypothetical protein
LRLQGLFCWATARAHSDELLCSALRFVDQNLEHALQKSRARGGTDFTEKCAPTFDEWAAILHSCFRISLVNADALATIASVVGLVPTATFHKQLKTNNK